MDNLSPEERQVLWTDGLRSPPFFCRTFLPHWFTTPLDWVYRGLFAILQRRTDFLLDFGLEYWGDIPFEWTPESLELIVRYFTWKREPEDPNCKEEPLFTVEYDDDGFPVAVHLVTSDRVQIIMPRGIGKTTIVNASNLIDIIYQNEEFIVYASESATHAEDQLKNVKRELENNDKIKLVYGDLVPDRSMGFTWREGHIETTNGVIVVARGRGAQIRGKNIGSKRPSKIVVDDVEDRESVKSDTQRNDAVNWLKQDVEPALPQIGKKRGTIIQLGTILAAECLLTTVRKDPEWISVKFGALVEGKPISSHYMTLDEYYRKRRSFERLGKAMEFSLEYDSEINPTEGRIFQTELIKIILMKRTEFVGVAEACDPAISEKRKADDAVIAVTGMTERGQHHVLDMAGGRGMTPRDIVDEYFRLHFIWNPTHHGVESIAYQAALIFLIKEEMFRKGKEWGPRAYFEITPITHGTVAKYTRVKGVLQPRYAAGYVTHQRTFAKLIHQLSSFGQPGAKVDYPDAVSMAITLLDPYAAYAYPDEQDEEGNFLDKLGANQYPPLEEVLGGEWRTAP